MKYTFVLLATMAAAVVMSCNKLSPKADNNESPLSYVYTINASVADVADVKSDYASDGKFSWSAGDQISVLFHNGDDNKFFTLSTSGTGASASFSGVIDSGYEIGASDGTSEDKKILAFFPASVNHVYTVGEAPKFFVPASADFTAPGAHYSANIPMYAILAAEGAIAFENIACAYKFVIQDLDDSINKVRVEISNQTTYGLSGLWPVSGVGGDAYIDNGYASPGSANSCLAYTVNVDDNKASVYVSTRYWGTFQPIVKIYNAENGYLLKTITAAGPKQLTDKEEVQPITISAPGTGAPIVSKFGIDWSSVSVAGTGATSAGHDGITTVKLATDASYFYVLLGVDDSKLLKGYDYSNYIKLYLGEEGSSTSTSWMWGTAPNTFTEELGIGWLLRSDAAKFSSSGEAIYNDSQAVSLNGINYYELKLNRSAKTYLMAAGTIHLGVLVYYNYYAWGGTQGDYYMYAPAGGSLLAETLPTYVAP